MSIAQHNSARNVPLLALGAARRLRASSCAAVMPDAPLTSCMLLAASLSSSAVSVFCSVRTMRSPSPSCRSGAPSMSLNATRCSGMSMYTASLSTSTDSISDIGA